MELETQGRERTKVASLVMGTVEGVENEAAKKNEKKKHRDEVETLIISGGKKFINKQINK